jgi:hypothetical protein
MTSVSIFFERMFTYSNSQYIILVSFQLLHFMDPNQGAFTIKLFNDMKVYYCYFLLFSFLIYNYPAEAKHICSHHFSDEQTINCATCGASCSPDQVLSSIPEEKRSLFATRCIDIIWEADPDYYALHGSNTTNRISQVVNEIENIYRSNNFDVNINVVGTNVLTNASTDPYRNPSSLPCCFSSCTQNIARVWCRFRDRKISQSQSFDIALLFSGKRLSNHGVASGGASCTSNAVAVGIGVNKSSGALLSVSFEARIHAHEMGHILSDGSHDSSSSNIMNPNNPFGTTTTFLTSRRTAMQSRLNGSCYQCSSSSPAPPPAVCLAPTGAQIFVSSIGTSSAQLNYSGPNQFSDYQYRRVGTATWTNVNYSSSGVHQISGLASNTTYQYRVNVWCGAQWSPWSVVESFTTSGNQSCSVPTNVNTSNATSSSCFLSWNPVSGATGYSLLYYSWSSAQWVTFATNFPNSSTTINGLSPGAWWCFAIKAECGGTTTAQSDYSCIQTSSSIANSETRSNDGISIHDTQTEEFEYNLFPNPSSGDVRIEFNLISDDNVTISLFDTNANFVGEILNTVTLEKGKHSFAYDGNNLSNGMYICTIKTANGIYTSELIISR